MDRKNKGKRISYAGVFLLVCMAITTIAVKAPESNDENFKTDDMVESKSEVVSELKIEEDENADDVEVSEEDNNVDGENISSKENLATEVSYINPVTGSVVSEFSIDVPVYSKTMLDYRTHRGVDLKVDINEEVFASESGEVIFSKKDDLMGETVKIKHSNGDITVYSGLLSTSDIVEGQAVTKGQTIGRAGGIIPVEAEDEPHLHFETIVEGLYVNPIELLSTN